MKTGILNSVVNKQVVKAGRIERTRKVLRTAVAAVVLGIGSLVGTAGTAHAAMDVTAIETTFTIGAASFESGIAGDGISHFPSSSTYDINYLGGKLSVDKIHTASTTFSPAGAANLIFRRAAGPNTDIMWYRGTGDQNSATLTLAAQKMNTYEEAFGGNNMLVGADNLFANKSDGNANNTNVERVDFVFTAGIKVSKDNAFAIFERGDTNLHDAFKVVAITAIDGGGNPTAYGDVLSIARGSYGKTDVLATDHYIIMRKDNNDPNNPFRPSTTVDQPVGGIVILTTDLAAAGSTIYGYSLLAPDTNGSGNDLLDWMNPNFFPSNTEAFTNSGGLDPIGDMSVLYNSGGGGIPEPSSAAVIGGIAGGLLVRRKRKDRAPA